MKNPVLEALQQGGSISNQSMANAANMLNSTANIFNSVGSLSMKMIALLDQAEAQRKEQLLQTTKLINDVYQNEIQNELERQKFQWTKNVDERNFQHTLEREKEADKKWNKTFNLNLDKTALDITNISGTAPKFDTNGNITNMNEIITGINKRYKDKKAKEDALFNLDYSIKKLKIELTKNQMQNAKRTEYINSLKTAIEKEPDYIEMTDGTGVTRKILNQNKIKLLNLYENLTLGYNPNRNLKIEPPTNQSMDNLLLNLKNGDISKADPKVVNKAWSYVEDKVFNILKAPYKAEVKKDKINEIESLLPDVFKKKVETIVNNSELDAEVNSDKQTEETLANISLGEKINTAKDMMHDSWTIFNFGGSIWKAAIGDYRNVEKYARAYPYGITLAAVMSKYFDDATSIVKTLGNSFENKIHGEWLNLLPKDVEYYIRKRVDDVFSDEFGANRAIFKDFMEKGKVDINKIKPFYNIIAQEDKSLADKYMHAAKSGNYQELGEVEAKIKDTLAKRMNAVFKIGLKYAINNLGQGKSYEDYVKFAFKDILRHPSLYGFDNKKEAADFLVYGSAFILDSIANEEER